MKRLHTLLAITCVLALAGPVAGQSLGEIAQKNAAAKAKKAEKPAEPAKTYTDKDLEAVKAPEAKVEPTTPVPATPLPEASPVRLTQVQPEENEWRGRMRAIDTQLIADVFQLDAARRRLLGYQAATERSRVDVAGVPLVSRQLQAEVLAARNDVSRLLATVAADRQQRTQLEEDARKAGVPPGWLR